MEEQINKKNIIYLFLILLLFFLFIYKGLILTGDEYLEEYKKFTDSARSSQSGMKKGFLNFNSNAIALNNSKKNEHSPLFKKLFDVLNNLENMKLNLGSNIHTLMTEDQKFVQNILKYFNHTDYNLTKEQINEIVLDAETFRNQRDKTNVDSILEGLTNNIEILRSITNENK